MSKQDYVLGTREPSGGEKVRDGTMEKNEEYPLPVVKENGVGRVKGQSYTSEMNEQQEAKRHSRIYTSQRGRECDTNRLEETGYGRGEKS